MCSEAQPVPLPAAIRSLFGAHHFSISFQEAWQSQHEAQASVAKRITIARKQTKISGSLQPGNRRGPQRMKSLSAREPPIANRHHAARISGMKVMEELGNSTGMEPALQIPHVAKESSGMRIANRHHVARVSGMKVMEEPGNSTGTTIVRRANRLPEVLMKTTKIPFPIGGKRTEMQADASRLSPAVKSPFRAGTMLQNHVEHGLVLNGRNLRSIATPGNLASGMQMPRAAR